MYTAGYKSCHYSVLAIFIIDYKKQVFITSIKSNIQYLICFILIKKKDLVTPSWEL